MEIRQCKGCGRPFQFISKPFCAECITKQDEMFIKVRDYLYLHPGASVDEVSEKTEVEERFILELLREERLSVEGGVPFLVCEQCGKAIHTGRYCDSCKDRLSSVLQSTLPKAPAASAGNYTGTPRRNGGMHLAYKKK